MSLLLDSHVLLWVLADDPTLLARTRKRLATTRERVLVSAATVWEIRIKAMLGKLSVPEDLLVQVEAAGLVFLPITPQHADSAGSLPRHHDDPFDRMLVAQAQTEGLTVVTRDRRFAAYHVPLLPA